MLPRFVFVLLAGVLLAATAPPVRAQNLLDDLRGLDLQELIDRSKPYREGIEDAPSPLESENAEEGASEESSPVTTVRATWSRLESDYAHRLRRVLDPNAARKETSGTPGPETAAGGEEQADPDGIRGPDQGFLTQYGYNLLSRRPASFEPRSGAVSPSYILGEGDELVISFRGQNMSSYRTRVDREGRVILPEMPPIMAAGRSFGEFVEDLERLTRSAFLQTEVFVSLGRVREISVMVLGEVHEPGPHRLSALGSVIDALVAARGVKKTGSLRRIRLVRGNHAVEIDLYDLFLTGLLPDGLTLAEGDRIIVRGIGDTVAVAGAVKRPGIFELSSRGHTLSGAKVLELAGGTLRPTGYRYLRLRSDQHGREVVEPIPDPDTAALANGDILLVLPESGAQVGAFLVDGHVALPGLRSIASTPTVAALLRDDDLFKDDPYTLFAVIQRTDARTRTRTFVPVDLTRIAEGRGDIRLQDRDRLIILGMEDVRYLSSGTVQRVLASAQVSKPAASLAELNDQDRLSEDAVNALLGDPEQLRSLLETGASPPSGATTERAPTAAENVMASNCRGLQNLLKIVQRSRAERFANAVLPHDQKSVEAQTACRPIFDAYPDLLPFLLDHAVLLNGEVRQPGAYPVLRDTSLGLVVTTAGGLSQSTDLSGIELTRFTSARTDVKQAALRQSIDASRVSLEQVAVMPGDVVHFKPVFTGRESEPVYLAGEFRRPGYYTIRKGERLSEVIARAGYLTEFAYPEGAVITRESVKEEERRNLQRLVRDMQSAFAGAVARADFKGNAEMALGAYSQLRQTILSIRPVGRVVAEADPAVLELNPQLDLLLEPGDRIYMPKRPNHVTVTGEVLNPSAVQFRSGRQVHDYIRATGGLTRMADDERTFVVFPDGTAQPVSLSSWNADEVKIPPGSTIVVPRDPAPFSLFFAVQDWLDVLYKLAVTTATLNTILDD